MRYAVLVLVLALILPPVVALAADDKPEPIDLNSTLGRRHKLALNRSMDAIAKCYNDQLQKNPALSGKLTLRVTIEPSGQARSIDVQNDSLGNDKVSGCVTEVLKDKTWPSGPVAVYFDNAFTFSAASD